MAGSGRENGRDLQVPVMEVVGKRLVIPLQVSCRLTEFDKAIGLQFAAGGLFRLLL